ncbi:GspH/FimT family pseudopilin [Oceanimonas pelagia]|uniref:Type II secretion system protein H n=1 Tax=Oceanimonas pelagia TaxID=3028314 RepID=A0AA50QBE2_9GAMM|nr:GspH/FimT family pseudopilin [Oceanimonas pelagia]WMC10031.1 GspH/FimT family pseudopilin [Oceanimonas pelagia]
MNEKVPLQMQRGLTLIELLVGLVVMTVLTSLAVPGFQSLREQYTVRSAGMAVYADLQLARSEAIKRNREVTVCFTNSGAANWSYALHDSDDCTGDIIESVSSQNYPYMVLNASYSPSRLTFGPRRSSLSSGNVQLSNGDYLMEVKTSNTGRIRTCSADDLIGVPEC